MKKLAICCALLGLLCTMAVAHEGHKLIKGKVTAINGSEISIQMEKGEKATIVAMPDTRILKGDDNVRLQDLKVGDGILVHGPEKDGKMQAEEIRIRTPRPATAAK